MELEGLIRDVGVEIELRDLASPGLRLPHVFGQEGHEAARAIDADVDLEIRTRGRILVRTPSITVVGSGRFARRNGDGSVRVELSSPRGDIEVDQR